LSKSRFSQRLTTLLGGFLDLGPAFLDQWPVPQAWANEIPVADLDKIPVRSRKPQVLVGATKMDEIMQEAMRMEEHPNIFYDLETMKLKDRPPGTNGPVAHHSFRQTAERG